LSLGAWSPPLHAGLHVSGATQARDPRADALTTTRLSRSPAPLSSRLRLALHARGGRAAPPGLSLQPHDRNGCLLATVVVWAHPGSLATTTGMLSLPRGTEMFQFPRCPPPLAVSVATDGLPHSEIVGSQPARGSPTHIAALPRPSSARSAEASSVCSFCLPCWNARRARRSASVMIKVS
jgi:hypothetical protein